MNVVDLKARLGSVGYRHSVRLWKWFASRSMATGMLTMVTLFASPIPSWAYQASQFQAEAQTTDTSKADNREEPLSRTSLSKMLSQKEFDLAIERVDAARAENPDDPQLPGLELTLAIGLRQAKPAESNERLKQIVDRALDATALKTSEGMNLAAALSYLSQLDQGLSADEKLVRFDRALEKLQGLASPTLATAIRSLNSSKIRLLISSNRHQEAKELLDDSLEFARGRLVDDKKASIVEYLTTAATYFSALKTKFPQDAEEVVADANLVANAFIERDDFTVTDFAPYYGFKSGVASALAAMDVERAQAIAVELIDAMQSLEDRFDEADVKRLSTYKRSISSLQTRIQSALKHKGLIGTPAPEIDGEYFVATEPVTMSELRGKVVLIDFWAVWCGPCIATFPHLIEWHDKFSQRGLVILGATHRYNFRWDDTANKAIRAGKDEEVAIEVELEMLEKFHQQHQLHHGFFVSPERSKYYEQFGVYGIPQAVLIDREGKVQMIRTGSSSENAVALEARIKELLGASLP